MSRNSPPLIVKLGGSLAGSAELAAWIAALDRYTAPLLIVPGGGVFADTVRAAQKTLAFDDTAAHHMALVAMQQYGIALAALWPRLTGVATPAAIRRALRLHHVPCWNPVPMALAAPLPKSWDVTSDTLAAWLAGSLKAAQLLLIKSRDPQVSFETVADLAAVDLVDPLFPHYAAASGATVFVAGPGSLPEAGAMLAEGTVPGQKFRAA